MSELELKHIGVPLEVTKADDDDDQFFVVEGMASTFGNVDLQGDIVERGAFSDSVSRLQATSRNGALLPMLFNHDMDEPIGAFTELRETDDGLFSRARLPKADVQVSGKIMPQIKAGSIGGLSIGFFIDSRRMEGEIRHIEKVSLVEISATPFPANTEAMIMAAKSGRLTSDQIHNMSLPELEKHLRLVLSRKTSTWAASKLKELQRDAGSSVDHQCETDPGNVKSHEQDDFLMKSIQSFVFALEKVSNHATGGKRASG